MSKEETKDLIKFLAPFNDNIKELALWLRDFIWDLYPTANELIYDNYNAVAVGWSPSDRVGHIFCSIAIYGNKDVHFGFYWGAKINDPEKKLLGKGSQYRYIKVTTQKEFPKTYIKKLMKEAYVYSLAKIKIEAEAKKSKPQNIKGATIVKSISEKKKRPGIIPLKKK